MNLYPTKTRLRRLRAVAAGEIHHYLDGNDYDADDYRVTAGMVELTRAGWVVLPTSNDPPYKRRWRITEAGEAVLNQHAEQP